MCETRSGIQSLRDKPESLALFRDIGRLLQPDMKRTLPDNQRKVLEYWERVYPEEMSLALEAFEKG